MSLTTVTLALDDKLRSLRNSSFDSNKDHLDTSIDATTTTTTCESATTTTASNQISQPIVATAVVALAQPLSLGENIPFADESPERPLIQPRSKPVRISAYTQPTARYTTRLYSQGSTSTSPNSPQDLLSSSQSHSSDSQEQLIVSSGNVGVGTVGTTAAIDLGNHTSSASSDDTDASTTSNPMEQFPASVRIDRDMIREMNRILTTLERKATKLNRSLSLNYKNHKGECCCNGNNSNNNTNYNNGNLINGNTNYRQTNRSASTLTKDEKTDKNINKKRQIQDGKSRRYTNRSIKRRHTVGGTHDYDVNKSSQNNRCSQQGHNTMMQMAVMTRTSSPDLAKDNLLQQQQDKLLNISGDN